MKTPRRPPTLRRVVLEFLAVVLLHEISLHLLARTRLMEHLLSPGSDSRWAILATVMFLLIRMFLLALGPGWLLARIWLWATREHSKGI